MTRVHPGLLLIGGAALVAAAIQLAVVRPLQAEARVARDRLLEMNAGALAERLRLAPERDVASVVTLDRRLETLLPGPGDPWKRFAPDGVRPAPGVFPAVLQHWLDRQQREGILERGAWPSAPWRSPGVLPTPDDMDTTVVAALLVEGLGRALRADAGGKVTGVALADGAHDVEVRVEIDPQRADGVVEILTRPTLGGLPFDLTALDARVDESGPSLVTLRIRVPEDR